MEADWEFEIGSGAPVIDAHWSGYIDLRAHPEQAEKLSETTQLPALADALVRLNAPVSPVWTSKCDVWRIDPAEDEIDPFEIDVPAEALPAAYAAAQACYIDMLSRPASLWSETQAAEMF